MNVDFYLAVSVGKQNLTLIDQGRAIAEYGISTAKNGVGQQRGSECTPLGWHTIRAKIGAGLPINSVFVGRRPTGEIYSDSLGLRYPNRDWILSRILWLGGLEPGKNRYGGVDTSWRYIYIHGTPDENNIGIPVSHGCIRMNNLDVLDLFERVQAGVKVYIHES